MNQVVRLPRRPGRGPQRGPRRLRQRQERRRWGSDDALTWSQADLVMTQPLRGRSSSWSLGRPRPQALRGAGGRERPAEATGPSS